MSNLTTSQQIEQLQAALKNMQEANDVRWLALTGSNCFLMVLGFALLEAGSLRAKNLSMVMLKQIIVASICGIVWYLWGHGLALGTVDPNRSTFNNFLGSAKFALTDVDFSANTPYVNWLFQMTFCCVSCSIISGAVGERLKFNVYFVYVFLQAGWIYPVTAFAQWADQGWNSPFNNGAHTEHTGGAIPYTGAIDAAGCGPVHIVGGIAAFVGSALCGPRKGRFDKKGNAVPMPGHNSALVSMGVLLLWFAWFSFNSGSRIIDQSRHHLVIARSCANTMIASCVAGMVTLLCKAIPRKMEYYPLNSMLSGVLTGLVAITAGSTVVEPWAAFIIGALAGFFYIGLTHLQLHILKIDDPVEAWAVHFGGGALGLFTTGLFAQPDAVRLAYADSIPLDDAAGAFMGGNGKILGFNMIALVFCTLWSGFFTYVYFKACDMIWGIRVSDDEEASGMANVFGDGYDYLSPIQQVSVLSNNLNYLRSTLMDGTAATPETLSQAGVSDEDTAHDAAAKADLKRKASQSSFAGTQQEQKDRAGSNAAANNNNNNNNSGEEDEELSFVDFNGTNKKTEETNEPTN